MKNFSNFIIFVAELIGTFGLVVAATGSIVYDAKVGETLGLVFISAVHFIGLSIVVFVFGRYSMAHFNPAVTIGFYLTGYIKTKKIPLYFAAQAIGAILGSLFVKYIIGDFANLGLNFANYQYPIPVIYGIEILATVFLMGGILLVVGIKKLSPLLVSMVVGGIVALDVFFFGSVSGASMNPIRSLAPAVVTGIPDDLWLYWTAPFIGSVVTALVFRKIIRKN